MSFIFNGDETPEQAKQRRHKLVADAMMKRQSSPGLPQMPVMPKPRTQYAQPGQPSQSAGNALNIGWDGFSQQPQVPAAPQYPMNVPEPPAMSYGNSPNRMGENGNLSASTPIFTEADLPSLPPSPPPAPATASPSPASDAGTKSISTAGSFSPGDMGDFFRKVFG